tara:strand:- start:4306 stop:4962 length:657 start_codon:yes stop_codon:yes gene_type:complete
MTGFQKLIYNTYLRTSRAVKNQPYKYRQDFSDFENNNKYVEVIKLSNFFEAHKAVNVELFFKAPYAIYGKQETFYLDFYLTSKAHKAYSLYLKQIKDADPDSTEQLEFVIGSARFVRQFCIDNKISIMEYLSHTPASTPSFIQHILQCNVSIYFLFGFTDFDKHLRAFDWELVKFILGDDFLNKLDSYRLNYLKSTKAKVLAIKSIEKINTFSRAFSP